MKRDFWWFAGFTAVFAALMAYVFWGTWSPAVAFVQPDQPVAYPADFLLRKWREICGGGAFVPGDLRFLLGGPYLWQELQYALAMYLAALGVAFYLKGRGLPPLARYGAGAAYGFMGYNFTLYSAGHLGWFIYLMYGPFCFGLIDRCVRKGRWINWILLGGVLAWASAQQPDMWLLFTVMAFAYGLFKMVMELKATEPGARGRRLGRILPGVAVTAVALAAVGWPQLHRAIFVETANRDKQIAGSTGAETGDRPKSADEIKAEREKRYVFCTNWSLPPDEMLEFAVPDIKGGSSDPRVSPKNTYHGRIGMQVAPGRWSPYRQHSLYMGFITLCFAVVGVVLGLWRRKGEEGESCAGKMSNRAEIVFWAAAAAVLLVCALGGFTPFYRLIFMLPMGDYIRCPVKFVHLIEWCIAVLAGFGIAALLNVRLARRIPDIACAAIAALVVVNAGNLAVVAARYCAVDPADTIRIALAHETGTTSLGFVMDAGAKLGEDEYILAGGTAFRDNAALKEALSKKECAPVSFWNFKGGRFVKTPRERAGFALLKTQRTSAPADGPSVPGAAPAVSILSTLAVCLLGLKRAVLPGKWFCNR